MTPRHSVRLATRADAAVIGHHRAAMFRDMGLVGDADVPALAAASCAAIAPLLGTPDYLGWLVEADGRVAAGGALVVRRLLPRPEALEGGEEAYLLNLYTEPTYRRRGLARALVETMLAWCVAHGIRRVSLHASAEGRPLYESFGFAATNEMRLDL
ncbi:MAG TPA: GNAT family N-acetyltransferase [Candidatus Binatia bacterium]|nr:GNAT family N-acetyltransferase [Candidatus Binatia bacterium]